MSKVSIVVVLLIAAALAVGAYFALASGSGGSSWGTGGEQSAVSVLSFSPAEVSSIRIVDGTRSNAAVKGRDGGWSAEVADGWPLDPTMIGTALNSIASLEAFGAAASGSAVSDETLTVELGGDEGSTHSITISREATGGRAVGIIDGGDPVLLPASALGLFDPQQGFGVESWRIMSNALPGALDNPQRVRIETGDAVLTLERTSTGWRMLEPANISIDDPTAALQSLLGTIEMTDFSPARALFPPTITVTTLDGVRSIGLTEGAARSSIATVRLPGFVQNVVADLSVPRESLADPARFMSRRVIAAVPGDVRVVGTATNAFENSLDGWVSDEGVAIPEPVELSIGAVLEAMTDGTATPSILDEQDRTGSFLTLVDRTGSPLGSFRAAQTESGVRLSVGRAAWTLRSDVTAPWLVVASDQSSANQPDAPAPSPRPTDPDRTLPEK